MLRQAALVLGIIGGMTGGACASIDGAKGRFVVIEETNETPEQIGDDIISGAIFCVGLMILGTYLGMAGLKK